MDQQQHSFDNGELPFEFRPKPVDEQLREDNWRAVEEAIRQPEEAPVRRLPWLRASLAAASLVLVLVGIWYVGTRTGTPLMSQEKTSYGEIKTILLPDSSIVMLNGNSSLRMLQQWGPADNREVWLDGEAYFQVQKQHSARKGFVVHTKEVDVEVLGTRFNVNTRRQQSIVSLEEGKVRLSVHGEVSVVNKDSAIVMRPGQTVVVDASSAPKVNEEKNVTAHSGWTKNEFHFDNTSLAEIARLMEDTYGYKMTVTDSSLWKLSISGDLRASNIQELIKVLEVTLKITMRIDREGKIIYVTRP
ncbi:MAG TPA: FecR domain-containing protein [Puia sp.]|jgi:ferric-dicitrate binding protein FerR (iron transport regulator)|nr:FecR domain-containing protein [Puia sp.]